MTEIQDASSIQDAVENSLLEAIQIGTEAERNTPLIGFTATFSRHDQVALSQVFEEIVFHQDVIGMLDSG